MTSTPKPEPERPPIERPEPDPMASDRRAAKRKRRLSPDAACALCGETDPDVLINPSRKHLIEEHHAAGIDNDPVTVPLCLNHHAKISIGQQDVGAFSKEPSPSVLERMIRALKSLGVFFEDLAKAFYRWAAQLSTVVNTLDENVPAWRLLPGMS